MTFEEHMYNSQCTVTEDASWLVFSAEEIQMKESSMANTTPPEYNSISTIEMAQIKIA